MTHQLECSECSPVQARDKRKLCSLQFHDCVNLLRQIQWRSRLRHSFAFADFLFVSTTFTTLNSPRTRRKFSSALFNVTRSAKLWQIFFFFSCRLRQTIQRLSETFFFFLRGGKLNYKTSASKKKFARVETKLRSGKPTPSTSASSRVNATHTFFVCKCLYLLI